MSFDSSVGWSEQSVKAIEIVLVFGTFGSSGDDFESFEIDLGWGLGFGGKI